MIDQLLGALEAGQVQFSEVLSVIESMYFYKPAAFKNGNVHNASHENQGSAKVFAFARLNGFNEAQTLSLFAEHYKAVLSDPTGTNHQNIRQFMEHGWKGISFETNALIKK